MCVRMLWTNMLLILVSKIGVSQVRETTITLGKDKVQAMKMDVDAPYKDVQTALHKYIGASSSPKKAAYISSERDSAKAEFLKKFLYDFARTQNYNSRDLEIGALIDSVQMDQSGMEERASQRMRIQNQIRELNSQLQALEQQERASKELMDQRRSRLEQLRKSGTESAPTKNRTTKSGQ